MVRARRCRVCSVNAYHGRLKERLRRFHGVAMKKPPNYLGWRRTLEALGHDATANAMILGAIGLDHINKNAIKLLYHVFTRHPDGAPDPRPGRQRGMSGRGGGEGRSLPWRQWRGPARRESDMQHHRLQQRHARAVLGAEHGMSEVQPLGVRAQDAAFHPYLRAEREFALIKRMSLGDEERVAADLRIGRADAEKIEHGVRRAVEDDQIIGKVEVAVAVDPIGDHHIFMARIGAGGSIIASSGRG